MEYEIHSSVPRTFGVYSFSDPLGMQLHGKIRHQQRQQRAVVDLQMN